MAYEKSMPSGKKIKRPKVVETRNLKKYDRTLFRNDLQQVGWETIFNSCNNNNLDEMTTTFQEIFQSILDMHAPNKEEAAFPNSTLDDTFDWRTNDKKGCC